jgi:hypothetical protein
MMRNERLEPRPQGAVEVALSPGVAARGHGILLCAAVRTCGPHFWTVNECTNLDVVLGQQSGCFFHIQVMGFK